MTVILTCSMESLVWWYSEGVWRVIWSYCQSNWYMSFILTICFKNKTLGHIFTDGLFSTSLTRCWPLNAILPSFQIIVSFLAVSCSGTSTRFVTCSAVYMGRDLDCWLAYLPIFCLVRDLLYCIRFLQLSGSLCRLRRSIFSASGLLALDRPQLCRHPALLFFRPLLSLRTLLLGSPSSSSLFSQLDLPKACVHSGGALTTSWRYIKREVSVYSEGSTAYCSVVVAQAWW